LDFRNCSDFETVNILKKVEKKIGKPGEKIKEKTKKPGEEPGTYVTRTATKNKKNSPIVDSGPAQ
jgi:hypothetical protein